MSNPRFMYLQVNGKRVGCVAVQVDRERNVARYQTSVAHPSDAFSKERARLIAGDRLLAGRHVSEVPVANTATAFHITSAIMNDLFTSKTTPARARKAAREWLDANPVV